MARGLWPGKLMDASWEELDALHHVLVRRYATCTVGQVETRVSFQLGTAAASTRHVVSTVVSRCRRECQLMWLWRSLWDDTVLYCMVYLVCKVS